MPVRLWTSLGAKDSWQSDGAPWPIVTVTRIMTSTLPRSWTSGTLVLTGNSYMPVTGPWSSGFIGKLAAPLA